MQELAQVVVCQDLKYAYKKLGLKASDHVLVHTSLKKLGYVIGGTQTIARSLMEYFDQGMVVVPAFSGNNSDPADWGRPPVDRKLWGMIRDELPAFDIQKMPTNSIGMFPEYFRSLPGVTRTNHPLTSFSLTGKYVDDYLQDLPLDYAMGKDGVLGKLYNNHGKVIFLGTGFDTCTIFHLAEYFSDEIDPVRIKAKMMVNNQPEWVSFDEKDNNVDLFEQIGQAFIDAGHVLEYKINEGYIKVFDVKTAVDFATKWFYLHPYLIEHLQSHF